MLFREVIGQQHIKKRLINSVRNKSISHAQMFIGPEGCGKLALALAYAQYINCKRPQANDSCLKCPSCIKSQKLIHPDIHYTYPTIGPKAKSTQFIAEWRQAILKSPYLTVYQWLQYIKAENKQGNITAEECEDINRKLSLTTYEGAYKILILWLPEYLGKEGNRLLKLIEEPPDNTVFLLIAENQHRILNTILSRTQQLYIPRLPDDMISEALSQQQELPLGNAQSAALLAEGNYNQALKIIQQNEQVEQQWLLKWLTACIKNNAVVTHQMVEELATIGRESQKNFLKYCLHFFRQCLLLIVGGQKVSLDQQEKQLANQFTQILGLEELEKLNLLFNKAHLHIGRNANPRILFFHLSIQLSDIYKDSLQTKLY